MFLINIDEVTIILVPGRAVLTVAVVSHVGGFCYV